MIQKIKWSLSYLGLFGILSLLKKPQTRKLMEKAKQRVINVLPKGSYKDSLLEYKRRVKLLGNANI